jgi:ketosteroid isomerase-like protein
LVEVAAVPVVEDEIVSVGERNDVAATSVRTARDSGSRAVAFQAAETLPIVAEEATTQAAKELSSEEAADEVIAQWRNQLRQSDRAPLEIDADEEKRHRGKVWGWIAALVLCAGAGAGWVVTHPRNVEAPSASAQTQPESDANGGGLPLPSYIGKTEEQNLTQWLQNWADAMGSRDAEAQTAFYADPVDRYFRSSNVGHAALLASKRGALENSDALSTLTVEKIEIVRQTADAASVRLVKHIVTRSPRFGPSEQKVQCQLKLRRIDGSWRIVEEHNLG